MLQTFFGLGPLHHGVSAIAFFNMVWNILEIVKHVIHRGNDYFKKYQLYRKVYGTTPDDDGWTKFGEEEPVMSEIFMDYVFVITISWILLEFMSNIFLQQSSYQNDINKIYVWLTVYYAELTYMILHAGTSILITVSYSMAHSEPIHPFHTGYCIMKSIQVVIVCLEMYVVHSYYILKSKAGVPNDIPLESINVYN